jgi:hypothetical protein
MYARVSMPAGGRELFFFPTAFEQALVFSQAPAHGVLSSVPTCEAAYSAESRAKVNKVFVYTKLFIQPAQKQCKA